MMKKLLFITFCVAILGLTGCETLKNIGLVPSELEMALGLKDALSQGLFKSFNAFADPNGNPLVRFAFPGEAQKIEKTLRDFGLDKKVDQVTGKFTRAMASAVTVAKPMFIDAVKRMSIKDAAKILVTDNNHAATEYFKQSMKPELMAAFRPIVDSTIKADGADTEWNNIAAIYNKIPFINNQLESNMTDFISARAVDIMFTMVANEEEEVRSKYQLRKTDLMQKAFGYAEQELKRRMQKN
jgi:Protein of unknown function (DUF4197)